ncbi:MAG: nucleoside hydrolase [Anaerolineales bacterium]|nr:nucleoside hydrolase [Anaerolineales bacterium]
MKTIRYILFISLFIGSFSLFSLGENGSVFASRTPTKVIVDTDGGVDDAAALAWLLVQNRYPAEVLGISTVAGNTSVENATNNVLTILDVANLQDVDVVIGAAAPRVQTLSHSGALVHGPDGLWFSSIPHDQSGLPTDVPTYFRDQALANPGAKLVTLGPLTNVAAAIEQYPSEMSLFSEIIVMGGSKTLKTPRGDFNIWQDTEASAIVLNSGLPITLMTVEASEELTIDQDDVSDLAYSSEPVAQLLASPLQFYLGVNNTGTSEMVAPLYDVAAVMYAVNPRFERNSEWALVKVVQEEGLAFGQTIIGSNFSEVIPMIIDDAQVSALADQAFTDPNFDLETELFLIFSSEPFNANTILRIKDNSMERWFMKSLD